MIDTLQDPTHDIRDAAAHALGGIGESKATGPLAKALRDPDSSIQGSAARALGRIGCTDSLRALLHNLSNKDTAALTETIDSLARIGHDAAVLPLLCLFNDVEDEELRRHIATALASLTEMDSVEEVFVLLHERRPLTQLIPE